MPQTLTGINGGVFPNNCTGPSPGDFITAASVNNGLQGILNECKYLFDTKGTLAGNNTWTGTNLFQGLVTCAAGLSVSPGQTLTIQPNATLDMGGTLKTYSYSLVEWFARIRYRAPQRPADAATISVDVEDGDTVLLPDSTPNTRTVQVENSTNEGERITIIMPEGMADGEWFNVKRADATQIAKLFGWTNATESGQPSWVELQIEGGVWRGRRTGGVVIQGAGW